MRFLVCGSWRQALGVVLVACGPLLASADEGLEWIERMNQALVSRNYSGTFLHERGGQSESLQVHHRVRGGQISERLFGQGLCLPSGAGLSSEDRDRVITSVKRVFNR